MVLTASNSYIKYGYESTYASGTTFPLFFGLNQSLSDLKWMTNKQELSQLNTPEVQGFVYGKNEGSCGVDYQLSNPWIFSSIFGQPHAGTETDDLDSETAGDQTITPQIWTSNPSENSGIRHIESMNLQFGYNEANIGSSPRRNIPSSFPNSGHLTRIIRNAKGALTTGLTLKTAINEKVDVTQNIIWGQEDQVTTTFSPPDDTSNDRAIGDFLPYMFHHAQLELPSGTPLGQVQDLELSFNPNKQQLYQIGSANSVHGYRGLLNIEGKFSMAVLDDENLQRVIDREPISNLRIVLSNIVDNGRLQVQTTDINEKSIEIVLNTIAFGEHSISLTPGEPVMENMPFQAARATITARSDSSMVPATS